MVVEQFQKCHIVLAASGVCFNSTGPSLRRDTVDLGRSIMATIIALLARTQGRVLGAAAAGPSSPKAGGLSMTLNYHLVLDFWEFLGFAHLFGCYYITQNGLKLEICLLFHSQCWNYKSMPPHSSAPRA